MPAGDKDAQRKAAATMLLRGTQKGAKKKPPSEKKKMWSRRLHPKTIEKIEQNTRRRGFKNTAIYIEWIVEQDSN